MTYTIISIIFSIVYFLLDKSRYKLIASGSFVLLVFFGLALDLINHPTMQVFFKHSKPKPSVITYIFYVNTVLALFICNFIVFLFYRRDTYETPSKEYSTRRLLLCFYSLSFFSLLGLSINLLNVYRSGYGIELLLLNPRHYEETFGFSVAINYLYFLNIPTLLVYFYIHFVQRQKVAFGKLIALLMVLISGFHGIKYTIFDTILIPAIFVLILNGKVQLKYLVLTLFFLIGIYASFSSFVRGGYYDSQVLNFVSYILPNYYNMFHNIETHPNQFTAFYNLFLPDKLQSIVPYELQINPGVNSTYSINDSYNMYTALDFLYTDFNVFGPFFLCFIILLATLLYNRKHKGIFTVYILTFLLYNFVMSFYTYSYIKIKYSYYLFIMLIIHFVCNSSPKNSNLVKKN